MMINSIMMIIFIFFLGILAGYFFFGGLYWTVRKINQVRNPAILFLFSFLIRTALLLFLTFWILMIKPQCCKNKFQKE